MTVRILVICAVIGCSLVCSWTTTARADIAAADITNAVNSLANSDDSETKYGQQADGTTRCNIFVRDLVQSLLMQTRPELQGLANAQFDALSQSTDWTAMGLVANPMQVLQDAQDAANNGKLVLAVYKNPDPAQPGHIALVVPGVLVDSTTWGTKVPAIAQAGPKQPCSSVAADKSVFASIALSCGFGANRLPNMELFKFGR
jgi:hypothetical protein